jgi:cytochrome c
MINLRTLGLAAGTAALLMSAPAMAAGDAEKGERVFKKCVACHSLEEGKRKVGPSLYAIIGRTAGTEDFKYSKINQQAAEKGLVWNAETLTGYLADPQAYLEERITNAGMEPDGRTKMKFRLRKDDEIADVIAYLESLQ